MKPHNYIPPDLTELTCGNNWRTYQVSIFGSFFWNNCRKPAKYPQIRFLENDGKLNHYVNHVNYHGILSFKCITIYVTIYWRDVINKYSYWQHI